MTPKEKAEFELYRDATTKLLFQQMLEIEYLKKIILEPPNQDVWENTEYSTERRKNNRRKNNE